MPHQDGLPVRTDFSKIPTAIQIPNLIEVQRQSYERFLQMDLLPGERDDDGLQSVFNSVFPISDFRGVSQLDFVEYAIGNWSANAAICAACTTCVRPAEAAARPSSPIRSMPAKSCAGSAAPTTPI